MGNIQKYKDFISKQKEKLNQSCVDLIRNLKSDIFPVIEEIIEAEEENFKSYKLKLVNNDDEEIKEKNINDYDTDPDLWMICVSIKFLTWNSENKNILKRLVDRIIIEFYDDMELDNSEDAIMEMDKLGKIYFKLK